ncbi:MAG: DMT family transporter [Vicingaceae bacterium]
MQKLLPHLALLTANIIYGLNYTIAKDLMPHYIKPFGFIVCRVIGALFLFWLVGLFIKERIDKKDFGRLVLCGIFGVTANQLMFFYGLNLTTPINAAIIMTSNPVLVLVVSAILIKEKITSSKIIGVILGMSGALLLILMKEKVSFAVNTSLGDLFIFLNAISYGVYLVLVKPIMHNYNPLTIIKWVFTFGLLGVLPFGYHQFTSIEWNSFTTDIWLAFLFVVIGTTFFAYMLNIVALKKVSPAVVSTYIYLQPILAAVVALYLGKDKITLLKVVATLMIFAGVFMVSRTNYRLSK